MDHVEASRPRWLKGGVSKETECAAKEDGREGALEANLRLDLIL